MAADHGRRLSAYDLDRHVFVRLASHTLDAPYADLGAADREEVHAELDRYEAALSYKEIPGVTRLLSELVTLGVPSALVTGANPRKADGVISQLGLQSFLAARATAADVDRGKPDPEGYLLAARRLGVAPERCVVFEDAISGVRAAAKAGTLCVGVGPTHTEAADVEHGQKRRVARPASSGSTLSRISRS